eukprot:TRINITY_DN10713_c0_g1_i1.p1 TRINITY_DN10713_c0_g1~~TRINITY_DN10713_c0_g1_i1.p1  ORF type:complete len:332 (+),score=25.25 TRINITY_DN10713_c0_g1_i1:181-1176(+)
MEVFVTFPGTDFQSVRFIAEETSTAKDVLEAVSKEWSGVSIKNLIVTYASDALSPETNLFSLGIAAGSELEVDMEKSVFCKEDFEDGTFVDDFFSVRPEKVCIIDASSFTVDGVLTMVVQLRMKHVAFVKADQVTKIGNKFLRWSDISTLDLSAFGRVTEIGTAFLCGCNRLEKVDFSPLKNVVKIHSRFLQGCCALRHLDISALANVTEIRRSFLIGCSKLESVQFPNTLEVTRIHDEFMESCSSLKSIDVSAFKNVTYLGYSFLESCSSLCSLDLSPLVNVDSISYRFLYQCSSLTVLKMMRGPVSHIGRHFLRQCPLDCGKYLRHLTP